MDGRRKLGICFLALGKNTPKAGPRRGRKEFSPHSLRAICRYGSLEERRLQLASPVPHPEGLRLVVLGGKLVVAV